MYAVIKTSGRQYRVSPGDRFSVEKLEGAPGSTIDLKEVLMVGGDQTVLGNPLVSGAKVTVVVEHQYRGPKILVFKKKRRHKYRKMRGHRSELTRLFVSEITTPSGVVKADTKPHVMDVEREARSVERKEKAKALKAAAHVEGAEMSADSTEEKKAAPKKGVAKSAKKSSGAKKPAAKKAGASKAKSKK
jgi:large subunit ribosomal protein L21